MYGYFPCQSEGDDLIVYEEDGRTLQARFTFPRQPGDRHLCLSDFFASRDSGRMDVVGSTLVTMGRRATEWHAHSSRSTTTRTTSTSTGCSVECAEALAELWHKRMREELGIAGKDAPEVKRLFSQGTRDPATASGIRPVRTLKIRRSSSPCCDAERIGVTLTDEFSLDPEQSTNAIIVHHPEAKYFNIV